MPTEREAGKPIGQPFGQSDPAGLRWTDHHCHLPADPTERAVDIEVARAAGVTRLVNVGVDVASSAEAIATARPDLGIWATAGVHPHEASGGLDGLADLVAAPSVVAVGECGLDYHYDHSPRDVQGRMFAAQIALARFHDLALVIHTREAWEDTFAILASAGVPGRTVFHCFTGGPEEARRCLDLGAHLSFSGIVTFPSADDVREAVRLCPPDRLLVETDSPYLAPVPFRGQRNEPANVALVGAAIAETKGMAVSDLAEATWLTAERVYRLAVPAP
ncbi:MAG: TatD family hydrolase [Acidimicrobiales bacterium]